MATTFKIITTHTVQVMGQFEEKEKQQIAERISEAINQQGEVLPAQEIEHAGVPILSIAKTTEAEI